MLRDNYDPESDKNGKPPKFFHTLHFFNFLWNLPRWLLQDLIKKYRKPTQEEIFLRLENDLLKTQLEYCKILQESKIKETVEKELH